MFDRNDTHLDDREAFIRDLYFGVLKRQGESESVRAHVMQLGAKPSFLDAKRALRGFIESDENRSLDIFRGEKIRLGSDNDLISIGSHCITSGSLKLAGLKKWSGPFDWIFSSIEMATHCIQDDFKIFLDQSYYERVQDRFASEDEVKCDHLYYWHKFGVHPVFNHFNPLEDKWFQYYQRCVERFRHSLLTGQNKVLVSIAYDISEPSFDDLSAAISSYSGVRALCLRTVRNCSLDNIGITIVKDINGNRLYEVRLVGELGPTNFTNQIDQLLFAKFLSEVV